MGFRLVSAPTLFAFNIALRALLIVCLFFAVLYLLMTTQYYATALVLSGLMLLLLSDLARMLRDLDVPVTHLMEALAARSHEVPLETMDQFVPGAAALGRTVAALQEERKQGVRQANYLQSLADTVAASLIVIAPDGHIILANRAAQMLAGEVVGRLEDLQALDRKTAAELLQLAPGSRLIVQLKDGKQMLASMAEFAVPGEASRRLLSLQTIVGELDAVELKAWRDMTRVLAHEMMNSLTPISSLSESLVELLKSPETQGATASGAAETIGRRAQGLLSFVERYRKVADLPEPALQPLRLGDFIRSIDTLMRPMMMQKNIAYSSSVRPASLTISADAELLNQAVINLLHNAMDAVTSASGPAVTLSASEMDGYVALTVADNGIGLSPDKLEDIFVPFFTTKAGGSGIGLSLARQIALAHHGRIDVNANSPRGTIFRIMLPAR